LLISVVVVGALVAAAFFATEGIQGSSMRAYTSHPDWKEFSEFMIEFEKLYENEMELL
jgi:hypothetical protein